MGQKCYHSFSMTKTFTSTQNKTRLDLFLSDELKESRSAIAKLIKDENITVNGKLANKPSFKLSLDDEVFVTLPEVQTTEALEIDFDIEILYEDDDLMVINKPSDLVVHPAPSHKGPTLVDWLKKKGVSLSTISGEERHGIVHRIDKDTTGALVIAKNNESHQKLSEELQNKTMGRYYLAIIDCPLKEDLIVEKPIGRNPKNRIKMGVVNGGRDAKSAFSKIALSTDEKQELISAKLFTGRTHQIRVHLSSLGRSILGDTVYGNKQEVNAPIYLHAFILYLTHPKTEEKLLVMAKPDKRFLTYLNNNFTKEKVDEILNQDRIISSFNFCS